MSDEDSVAVWMRSYEERLAKQRDEARQTLKTLCGQLADLGVETVHIEYDGYGDSGTIEHVRAVAGEVEIDLAANLTNELMTAAEMLLPDGWENNEGAFGVFVINVAERRVTREHNWRVESTEYEEEEWQL